jgi:hypothetical protein
MGHLTPPRFTPSAERPDFSRQRSHRRPADALRGVNPTPYLSGQAVASGGLTEAHRGIRLAIPHGCVRLQERFSGFPTSSPTIRASLGRIGAQRGSQKHREVLRGSSACALCRLSESESNIFIGPTILRPALSDPAKPKPYPKLALHLELNFTCHEIVISTRISEIFFPVIPF